MLYQPDRFLVIAGPCSLEGPEVALPVAEVLAQIQQDYPEIQVIFKGSFDKAIFVSIPIDWIISTPSQAQRILTLRPITRDGGANLASARSLNRHLKRSHNAAFKREYGRLWK